MNSCDLNYFWVWLCVAEMEEIRLGVQFSQEINGIDGKRQKSRKISRVFSALKSGLGDAKITCPKLSFQIHFFN